MKKLLLAVAFLLPFIASAQTAFSYKINDRYLYYGDVVKVDTSFTVADLYKDAKLYITRLALANTKFITDDQPGGTVEASIEEPATFKTETGVGDKPMTLKYNIKFELKKGRYRYTFDNIVISYLDKDKKSQDHSLYDLDKEKGGGLLGVGQSKRVLKATDALFLHKIDMLKTTMSKRSDDF
ncbi:DUF4468 domain-containing protein [Mucilaginibacter sp.]